MIIWISLAVSYLRCYRKSHYWERVMVHLKNNSAKQLRSISENAVVIATLIILVFASRPESVQNKWAILVDLLTIILLKVLNGLCSASSRQLMAMSTSLSSTPCQCFHFSPNYLGVLQRACKHIHLPAFTLGHILQHS